MAKIERPKYLTPVGFLGWPCAIQEPDTKFADDKDPNDKGDYKARMVFSKEDPKAKAFLANLESIWEQFANEEQAKLGKKKLKTDEESLPWADELDRETQEPTGNIVFRFKLRARVTKKDGTFFEQRPKVFGGGDNKLIVNVPPIGAGSQVVLSGKVHLWHTSKAGMTLWLEAVQLRKLVEKDAGGKAEDYGFEAADGGYTDDSAFESAVSNAGGDNNGDF